VQKPVSDYRGADRPSGTALGHAGRDHQPSGGQGTEKEKYAAMGAAGIRCVKHPADLGSTVRLPHEVVTLVS